MLNCPFCNSGKYKIDSKATGYIDTNTGEKHKLWRSPADVRTGMFSVRCTRCHARGGTGSTEKEAIDNWNKRVWVDNGIDQLRGTNFNRLRLNFTAYIKAFRCILFKESIDEDLVR